jgi:predicted SAM-dependent methyltransferase
LNPIRSLARSRTTKGVRTAVKRLREEWAICERHRKNLKRVPKFLSTLPIKLHLGCGPNYKAGWINIDLFDKRADLQLDLREPWPFPSGSASHIYSEHVFEHFRYGEEVPHLLAESLRILHEGGFFEVGVPDTECALKGYQHPEDEYWEIARKSHPSDCVTQMEHINYHFRQGDEHKYAWDCETLKQTLEMHNFSAVERRKFDPQMDDASRNPGTLYMRARKKPGAKGSPPG